MTEKELKNRILINGILWIYVILFRVFVFAGFIFLIYSIITNGN